MLLVLPADMPEVPLCLLVPSSFVSELCRVALRLHALLELQGRRRDGHLHVLWCHDGDIVRLGLLGHLGHRARQCADVDVFVEGDDERRVVEAGRAAAERRRAFDEVGHEQAQLRCGIVQGAQEFDVLPLARVVDEARVQRELRADVPGAGSERRRRCDAATFEDRVVHDLPVGVVERSGSSDQRRPYHGRRPVTVFLLEQRGDAGDVWTCPTLFRSCLDRPQECSLPAR
jgi:hypothetical protein